MFFIQFYPVVIVLERIGIVGGFRRSYRVVRANLVSTLGYAVVAFIVSRLTALPISGYFTYRLFIANPGTDPWTTPISFFEATVPSIGFLIITIITFTFNQVFAVAFYRRHTAPRDGEETASVFTQASTRS